jgi:hypothetical protein
VTGEFVDASGLMHGFSRSPLGAICALNAPGAGTAAGQGTRPSTNNWAGEVTGWYVDGGGLGHGFVWQPQPSTILPRLRSRIGRARDNALHVLLDER